MGSRAEDVIREVGSECLTQMKYNLHHNLEIDRVLERYLFILILRYEEKRSACTCSCRCSSMKFQDGSGTPIET